MLGQLTLGQLTKFVIDSNSTPSGYEVGEVFFGLQVSPL